jgi:glycosyltransferase involved in cell wall biosynthesis
MIRGGGAASPPTPRGITLRTEELRIALLAPIAWRTPPRHYGPWERVVSLLSEGLVERGVDVTLFATGDSLTRARLAAVCPRPWEEDPALDRKVWECLHIARCFERAAEFDLIHNHFDFLPLSYSRLVSTPLLTTIHGFSSPGLLPAYAGYADRSFYVSISDADRAPGLPYAATVHHGIDLGELTLREAPGEDLVFFGRIHPDKGTAEAIEIARRAGRRLVVAGIVQDRSYFAEKVEPQIDGRSVCFVGSVGPPERDRLLGSARALLHPIAFEEPFGLSVVEAMACGTPVIAFRRGSMPEVVREGVTGFLVGTVEEAAACVDRVADLDRRACRRWVEERFSRDRMVDGYLEVYDRILSGELRLARHAA